METRKQPKAAVRLYHDFDGTATLVPGGELVFTDFYLSLFKNPERDSEGGFPYATDEIKPRNEMIAILRSTFAKNEQKTGTRDTRRMTKEFIQYLKLMLALGEQIDIVFISKNRGEYIQAMLAYEGFTDEEIARIKIYANSESANFSPSAIQYGKSSAVETHEKENNPVDGGYWVFDDDKKDCDSMANALKNKSVTSYNCEPGKFQWQQYQTEISEKLGLSKEQLEKQQSIIKTHIELEEALNVKDGQWLNVFRGKNKPKKLFSFRFKKDPKETAIKELGNKFRAYQTNSIDDNVE